MMNRVLGFLILWYALFGLSAYAIAQQGCPSLPSLTTVISKLKGSPLDGVKSNFQQKSVDYRDEHGKLWRLMMMPDLAKKSSKQQGLYRLDWYPSDSRIACAYNLNHRDLLLAISQFAVTKPQSDQWQQVNAKSITCQSTRGSCNFTISAQCKRYTAPTPLGTCK